MSTELLTGKVWSRLKKIRQKNASQRSWVAVAYIGKGAAKLLPLNRGSRLVVNASDEAVKAGQTCPADLLALQDRGVRIFNYVHLHAKVYVFGSVAAIGSANASRNSSEVLTEALVLTTDRLIVNEAKGFVQSLAKNELGPDELVRLKKIYREPKRPFPATKAKGPRPKSPLPNIRVVHLHADQDWSEEDWKEQNAGEEIAEKRRQHKRAWMTDYFRWTGVNPFEPRHKIMMITREASGKQLVHPPSTVLHVRPYRTKRGRAAFVYVEHQDRRRRELQKLAKALGRKQIERLRRGGTLRQDLSLKLYDVWQVPPTTD